ncbi:MAG: phosphatidate cytidylyltransferase [Acidiferrobacterales bacterium]
MLWKRVLTAVVLLPLVLWALFALPPTGIAVLIGLVVTIATWELTALIGLKTRLARALYTILMIVFGASGSLWLLRGNSLFPLFAIASLWWIYAFVHILKEDGSYGGVFGSSTGRLIAGFLVMLPTWLGFLTLYINDSAAPNLLLYVLVLVWVADSFAYFSGKAWGRHKLAPAVSPGKSIEGVVGGLVGVATVAIAAELFLWQHEGKALLVWILLALLTGAVSVVGDLTESIFKRRVGAKNSGTLLPGHGGMFDRIDALTAAIPVFAFGWQLTNGAAW